LFGSSLRYHGVYFTDTLGPIHYEPLPLEVAQSSSAVIMETRRCNAELVGKVVLLFKHFFADM